MNTCHADRGPLVICREPAVCGDDREQEPDGQQVRHEVGQRERQKSEHGHQVATAKLLHCANDGSGNRDEE